MSGPDVPPEHYPPDYPARWETDVVLSDGGTVHVRPIRPDDVDRLVAFHSRQSAESIYYRYFSPRPRLSERDLERFTTLDYAQRMAFIALLGDDLVGVARYDTAEDGPDGSPRAEVAFFIDDRHHGRGLATLLLEYLAVAATEHGINGFVATVLPDNRGMINVFRRAGFEVATRFADGVVEVDLGIRPTEEGQERIEERARRAEAASVSRLLTPATVAVIGAGRRPGTAGHEVLRQLLDGGFNGAVYPVNRNAAHVRGVRAYATVSAIPDEIDLAVIAVPAPEVEAVLADCAQKRVDAVVVLADGFAALAGAAPAAGAPGAAAAGAPTPQQRLASTARRHGMRLIGPASTGVINHDPHVSLRASINADVPPPGRIALSTQSGSMGNAILAYATETGLGLSAFVNLGDKADVSANDLMQFWRTDPRTGVICLYVESFGNPRKFFRIARRVGRIKPLVVMRTAGLDFGGGAAWPSPDTYSALMTQAGIIETGSLAELFDVARLLAAQPLPAGRRVAVLANSPGTAVLGIETVRRAGLQARAYVLEGDPHRFAEAVASATYDVDPTLPVPFTDERAAAARGRVGFVGSIGQPEADADDGGFDAVLVVFAQTMQQRTGAVSRAVDAALAERRSRALAALPAAAPDPTVQGDGALDEPVGAAADHGSGARRPVSACYLGETPATRVCAEGDVPRFRFPEDAARALARAARYAQWRAEPVGERHDLDLVDRAAVDDVLRRVLHGAGPGHPVELFLDDALALLRAAGLDPVAQREAHGVDDAARAAAEIGYPVALKAGRRGRLARSVATGLALGLHDEAELRSVHALMAEAEPVAQAELTQARLTEAMLVQAMAEPGVEVQIIGRQDDRLGALVALGRGGALGSEPEELAVRLVPLTTIDATRLVDASPLPPLLARLEQPDAVLALHGLLGRLSALMEAVPEVVEVRLDPVLVAATGVSITDVRVQVAAVAPPSAPPVRRLGG